MQRQLMTDASPLGDKRAEHLPFVTTTINLAVRIMVITMHYIKRHPSLYFAECGLAVTRQAVERGCFIDPR